MADFSEMMAALHDGRIDWGTPEDAAPIMAAPSDISGPANANMQLGPGPPQMGGKMDYKSVLSGIAGLGGALTGGGGQDQDLPPQTIQPSQQFGRIGAGASPMMASPAWPYGR